MAAYKVGAKVEGQFTEDNVWYAATIDAVNPDGQYAVTYTEYGNSEVLPVSRIRPVAFAFKVGEKVEGQFTEDDVWYGATIDAVSADGHSYTVTYTEYGNSETIPSSRVKPLPSVAKSPSPAPAPAAAAAPAPKLPKWKVGDKIEGQFTEDDVWYAATIDAVTADGQYAVTYTEYGNAETIPESRIRLPEGAPAPVATAAPLPKWKVGDKVEGQFTEDDVWYAATIDAVTPDGQYAVTYTEYGNAETIPESRIRPVEGTTPSTPASAAPAAASDDAWGSSSASTNGASDGFGSSSFSSSSFSSSGGGDKSPTTTLFVAGLSYNTTEDSLMAAFSEYAGVDKVRIVKDRDTGKSKGFGYVEFFDVESAEKAFNAATGKEIDGRSIRLDYSQPKGSGGGGSRPPREPRSGGFGGSSSGGFGGSSSSGGFGGSSGGFGGSSSGGKAPSSSLFVGGLSFDTDETSLEAAFAEFGNIDKVRIVKDRETGKSKGFGYVDFFDLETAEKAMKEANGREVDGRPIRLDFSQPKGSGGGGKGGFGGSSGGSSFGGGSSSFGGGDSGSSFGSSNSSSFGSSAPAPAPAPQRGAGPADIIEPFDPSVLNRNRKVAMSTGKGGELTLVVSRSFQDEKKGKLLAHIH